MTNGKTVVEGHLTSLHGHMFTYPRSESLQKGGKISHNQKDLLEQQNSNRLVVPSKVMSPRHVPGGSLSRALGASCNSSVICFVGLYDFLTWYMLRGHYRGVFALHLGSPWLHLTT